MSSYLIAGNIALFFGTILSILAVLSDRRKLRGHSPLGSLLVFLGVTSFELYYLLEVGELISSLLNLLTIVYWFSIMVFAFRQAIKSFKS